MKRIVPLLLAVMAVGGTAHAEKITIAATYGSFFPVSSATKNEFSSSFSRFSFTTFEPSKPTRNRIIFEVGNYDLNGDTQVKLLPITVGIEKGMKVRRSLQPYTVLRAGPYYGRIRQLGATKTDTKVGLNASASLGVVFKKSFYAEARYDYFSRFAGFSFDGLSLSVGVKLFTIKL